MPGGPGVRNRTRDPRDYWRYIAPTKPKAQKLAKELGLKLPGSPVPLCPNDICNCIDYPIRRLIITGNDKPSYFSILLGPRWEDEKSSISWMRMEVLVPSPPEPPNLANWWERNYDEGSPYWAPRTPNRKEEAEIPREREKQRRRQLARQSFLRKWKLDGVDMARTS